MKTWIPALFTFVAMISLSASVQAQDYNDIGRTRTQEFEILKYNGFKMSKLHSNEAGVDTYLAKKPNQNAQFDNIITVDKQTDRVTGVIWNFNHKNFAFIKSLLTDMNPMDSSYSRLENKKGQAEFTTDPYHEGYGMVVWKKKS